MPITGKSAGKFSAARSGFAVARDACAQND
jgi:hypothetical protein